jgi:hypothetical protein
MVQVGEIIQIAPSSPNEAFHYALAVVREVKEQNVLAYVQVPGEEGGTAFVFVRHEHYERCGAFAPYIIDEQAVAEGMVQDG